MNFRVLFGEKLKKGLQWARKQAQALPKNATLYCALGAAGCWATSPGSPFHTAYKSIVAPAFPTLDCEGAVSRQASSNLVETIKARQHVLLCGPSGVGESPALLLQHYIVPCIF